MEVIADIDSPDYQYNLLLGNRLGAAGIPNRFRGGLDSFNSEMSLQSKRLLSKARQWVEQFEIGKSDQGLYLSGGVGCGKTHLACSIAVEIIARHIGHQTPVVQFRNTAKLFLAIRSTFNSADESEQDLIDELIEVPLLIIDDLGVETPKEYIFERLYMIINGRYERGGRPIIITSNYNGSELLSRFHGHDQGARVISRLNGLCESLGQFPDMDFRRALGRR